VPSEAGRTNENKEDCKDGEGDGARGGGLGGTVVGDEVRASTGKGVDWG